MTPLRRRARMPGPALGALALLAAAALAGCGSSAHAGGSQGSGATASTGSTGATSTGATSAAPPAHSGSLSLSPTSPTVSSELSFRFTAPVASGVHGNHVINYSLSLLGPELPGCVGAHEAAAPAVAAGARGQITIGPAELHAQWCAGHYVARLIELRSAHCTGSVPCPQYVAVVGVLGRVAFRIRRG